MDHITGEILGKTVNIDTLYFAWACMAFILLLFGFLALGVSEDTSKFGSKQHVAEGLYGFIRGMCKDQVGHRADHFVFFIGSIFFFILINYYAGLLPWKMGSLAEWWPQLPAHGEHGHGHPWHGASPCADANIPAAMALIVIPTYFITGAVVGGFKYVQLYLPINFGKKGISLNLMCVIEIMDLFIRPLTLTLRLFANTVAGETLLATAISMVAIAVPILVLGFEMAVGLLQSYIFTILSIVYIGLAVQHAEHLLHEEAH